MTIANYNNASCLKDKQFTFGLDEHSYASVLANIIRAKKCICKQDIKYYYDRDHWTMLMLYYIRAIKLMKQMFQQSFNHVGLADYYELIDIYKTNDIECMGAWICHTTCLEDDMDILHYTIVAATMIQTILEHEYMYKPETITKLVAYNIEASDREYNENFTKKLFR